MRQQLRKIKVLGYPFAGGQPRGGVELTPAWLRSQSWFNQMQNSRASGVEYEEIQVSSPVNNTNHADQLQNSDGSLLAKNIHNVMKSSEQLKR